MLYLDYSRKEGEWIPNEFGGRENLDAVLITRHLEYSLPYRLILGAAVLPAPEASIRAALAS